MLTEYQLDQLVAMTEAHPSLLGRLNVVTCKEVTRELLARIVGKRVRVDSRYIPDKPRCWIGKLQSDEYGSLWIENEHGEVHFSLRDVEHVDTGSAPPNAYLPNVHLKN